MTMATERITRRHALGAGAAAIAAGALTPAPAFAGRRPALFELDLGGAEPGATVAGAGWRTTAVLRAPRRFDLLGLRWARGGRLDAQVRTRRRGGAWSPWLALHTAGDHAPDAARAVAGTEPAWTDTADELQLRLRGHARGLRVRFVRAKPTATASRAITSRLRRRAAASASASAPPRAQGQPPPAGGTRPPRIFTRTEWGGDSVPPKTSPTYGEVQLGFVHHTVTANAYRPEDSASIVLGIARYHRDSNGWNDIGYNFLVDKYGQVFEGRAGGMELAVVGAQAQGYNSVSTGVACLGDFSAIPNPEPGMGALAQLLAWKLALHGVPPEGQVTVTSQGGESNRYRAGTPVTFQRISGHRDGDATSCPGNVLYGQLPALRTETTRRTNAPAPAAAAASSLTLRVATRSVRYPAGIDVSGQLRFGDGSSPAGAALELQFQPRGGAWQPVGSATTGADGQWFATAAVPASGLVRAVYHGDGARPAAQAAATSVTVLPRLTMALSARRVRRGTTIRAKGTLSPAPAAGKVLFVLERQVGKRWVPVQRKRINVRNGGYDTRVRPRLPGLYRLAVSTPGATKRLQVRVTTASAGATGGAAAG